MIRTITILTILLASSLMWAAGDTVPDLTTHLIVQGTQGSGQGDALGYSVSIDKATGQMTAAGAGESAGFVIFGACTPN